MLLRYGLGEENAAKIIENAVIETLNQGFRTGDLYYIGTVESSDLISYGLIPELQHKRECTNQILKAVMVINDGVLFEMEIPRSYFESLPNNDREYMGDVIYRYITSDQFSPECLLDCLEFSSKHQALEITNRVEASTYIWRRKNTARNKNNADRMYLLTDRAESIMLCLKQRFPGLTQTSLDMSKI